MLGTTIVSIVLAVIIGRIIFTMRKDRKKGKPLCGGNCSKCKGCR